MAETGGEIGAAIQVEEEMRVGIAECNDDETTKGHQTKETEQANTYLEKYEC